MKVRYLTGMAGVGFVVHAGDERDVDDAEAQRLIAAGFAKAVTQETMAVSAPEKAVISPGTPRPVRRRT